ncbi:MAG: hypothetical protein K2I06_13925 [Ruminococcus sp.]|nr:hypothetical protein [Ruminococcus sp.]
MTICEHCGAHVFGEICEYCDMPVNNKSAPPKIIYKSEKSESTISMPVIKHRKKFLRTILAGAFAVCSVNFIVMAVLANNGSKRSHIQSPAEYAIVEYNNYNEHHESHHNEETADERPVYDKNKSFKENGIFPSGTYQIGVDIPEGIYIFIPELSNGHGVQGVYSDPSCSNQISSAYVHFDGSRIAEISGNGYLDFSWANAYNLDMHPEIVNDPHTTDGMFIVGRDIEAGTYHLESPSEIFGDMSDNAEWYIYSSINAVGAVTKESGILESWGGYMENITNEITLSDGEFLELRHCIVMD